MSALVERGNPGPHEREARTHNECVRRTHVGRDARAALRGLTNIVLFRLKWPSRPRSEPKEDLTRILIHG